MKSTTALLDAVLLASPAWAQAPAAPPADAPEATPPVAPPAAAPKNVPAPPIPDFGWFGELAGGCWTTVMPDKKSEHTQCYTRQFDRFIRGAATLLVARDGKMRAVFAGDSVFALDATTKRIPYYIWGSDGNHRQLEATYVGDELHFPIPSKDDPAKVAFRSVWKRVDKDSFEVRRERPVGEDKWKEELKVVYKRLPPKETKAK